MLAKFEVYRRVNIDTYREHQNESDKQLERKKQI